MCAELKASQFERMQETFGQTGGLVASDLFLQLLRGVEGQPISVLARHIVKRGLVNFEWKGRTLIPMFQVCCGGTVMQPYMPETLYELVDVFDDWEVSYKFAQPNEWLAGRAPATAMAKDPEAVFLAARADRFIAKG